MTEKLGNKFIAATTDEEREKLICEAMMELHELRDALPEGSSIRCLINFNFAAVALRDSLIDENKILSLNMLTEFMSKFAKVTAIEHLMRGGK